MKNLSFLFLLFVFHFEAVKAQIIIDNNAPYDNPAWMVDNILLGGGVSAFNHSFQGDSLQIGWFNAANTSLGINSGIVMACGDIYSLDPIIGSSFPFLPNIVTDPDLLAVANSVPGMIGQTFSVSSINDVAVLEFDFIPTSDSLKFNYVFGSQEYFGFENSPYNDVFGFFLSGPGITGPWSSPAAFPNGSINLAVVPNTNPPLPITISSVCNDPNAFPPAIMNPQYFIDNQGTGLDTIADADGLTTVLTARALVQCGETYHIRLAIADGSDASLNSYVWLEAGSFFSQALTVVDDLGIDSNFMNIACKPDIVLTADGGPGVTYEWFDSTATVFSTNPSVTVGVGSYWVTATYLGCPVISDTLTVISVSDSLPHTNLSCVWEESGDVYFDWDHPVGASSTTVYSVMGSENLSGPYSLVAEVDYPNDIYAHPLSNVAANTQFYYITTASTCAQDIISSDTLSAISFNISHTNVNCWDDTDGHIAIDVYNTQLTPFTYSLDGVPNPNAYPLDSVWENLPTGVYDITISDNANCIITTPISITAPGFPLQALVSGNMNVCYGSNLGFAIGSGAGGTPGYSYEWFDASYTSFSLNDTAFGLSSGSYYLEVMDVNGCDTFTSVQVIAPQTALSGSPQMFGVVCKGDSTGMLVGDAQGSWAPYQYYWLSSTGDTLQGDGTFLSVRDTLFDLISGSYELHVYDAQGCFIPYSMTVGEPATSLSIDSVVVVDSIACYGDSIGQARLYASGGMPNYAYLWDNGEIGIIADELTSGYHSVSLSDDWGCKVVDSIYIPESPEIQSQVITIQDVSCYGEDDGQAWIESVGGIPTYIYFWSNGHTGYTMPDTASGLWQGGYYVTTRDALGCEVVDSIYISEPELLTMEAFELDWVDCYGADNGLAYAVAEGGTAPYTFVWDNGQWTGDTINSLTPGLHTVVVTDSRGCSATDTMFTHEPSELIITIDDTQTILAYCIGVNTASLTAMASGGTPGYSYEWNDNGVVPQTTTTASSLLAGVYTITVTDTKGCTASDTRDIDTVTSTMDANVTSSSQMQYIGGNDISCFGEDDGGAIVTAWGAHAPYTYQWTGPNNFNNTNNSITNLSAGIYSVVVRDTNNCLVNRSILMTEPDEISFTILGAVDESCLGACDGQVQVEVIGGVAPYTGVATENTTGNIITSFMANDSVVPGMCSGTYTFVITDANDCLSPVINGGVNQQQTIGATVMTTAHVDPLITNILCNGMATGTLQVLDPDTVVGYSYSWQNLINPGVSISDTTQAINLLAGTYILYAHYANSLNQNYLGCTTTDTVSITELAASQASTNITHVDCYGNSTGSIEVDAISGGTSPYIYLWNPGGLTGSAFNALTAGTYTLTITDGNNCQQVDTFEITQPQTLNVSIGISSNGYVLTAIASGGTAPFSYSWREQANNTVSLHAGATYNVTTYGSYYVIITDANGCEINSEVIAFTGTWDCIEGLCVDPEDGSGLYGQLSACNAACIVPTWDCVQDACIDPGTGQGIYISLSQCLASCISTALEESSAFEVSIYPNPFKKETTIDFGMEIKKATVSVVDVYGKQIESYIISNAKKYILKRNNKASGIYFVEIEIQEKERMFKIIIK